MTRITFVTADGEETVVDAEDGETVMDVAMANDIDGILAECGGACACATCHVYVDENFIDATGEVDEMEESMLEFNDHRKPTSRLSCQLTVSAELEGARFTLPDSQY